jgi:WYL domain
MLPPQRIAPPTYHLRYHLLPVVARRRDIAVYFPNTQIEYHDDGSATITAIVTNLWQTRQILLRYGDACKVLGPHELLALFRKTAQGLTELYDGEGDDMAGGR